jgi:hypothetical protein
MGKIEAPTMIDHASESGLIGYPVPISREQAKRLDRLYQAGICEGVHELLSSKKISSQVIREALLEAVNVSTSRE